jgi:hypothetical protein
MEFGGSVGLGCGRRGEEYVVVVLEGVRSLAMGKEDA